MVNPIFQKSIEFTSQIALFHETYSKSGFDTTVSQKLLKAATKMGSNINKSAYCSREEFGSYIQDALEDVVECEYFLNILAQTNLFVYDYSFLMSIAEDIKGILIASLNAMSTAGASKWDKYNSGRYGGYSA